MPEFGTIALWSAIAIASMLVGAHRMRIRMGDEQLDLGADGPICVLAAVWLAPLPAFAAGVVAGLGRIAAATGGRDDAPRRSRMTAIAGAAIPVLVAAAATAAGSFAIRTVIDEPSSRQFLAAAAAASLIRLTVLGAALALAHLARTRRTWGVNDLRVLAPVALLELVLSTLAVGAAGPFAEEPWVVVGVVLVAAALTAIGLGWIAAIGEGQAEHATLKRAFTQFVSGSVADRVLASERGAAALAEQRTITVLFADVQGFTSWAEAAEPAEVVSDLNELLADLAAEVLASGGTIDKFTGDGLMAFWGAPDAQPDHAARALRAAPALLMRAREFNVRRQARGKVALEIGIGIHTGPAIVGPVGHPERMDYTAMGDTVNVAARLEAATRVQHCPILLSESTFLKLPADMQRGCARLESIELKGRRERIRLYGPADLARYEATPR